MATQAVDSTAAIDIGRVIQRGFGTIARNVTTFLGLALLLVGVPGLMMHFMIGTEAVSDPISFAMNPLWWLSIVVAVISGFLLQASVVRAAIKDLKGEPVDFQSNLMVALGLLFPMIGLAILVFLATAVATLFLVIPGIIVYIMLIVSVPVLVEERRDILASMRRSTELTKGSRWRIFLLGVVFVILSIVVSLILGAVGALVSFGSLFMIGLANIVGNSITGLISAAFSASLYVELRTVKEGAAVESLGEIFS